jgi:hypothetical protein
LDSGREQVLARLWQIANLSPQMTRGSITGQVKAIAMIIAIQGLIPDRRNAGRPEKPSAAPSAPPPFYKAAWRREQEQTTTQAQSKPAPAKKDEPGPADPQPTPGSPAEPSVSAAANPLTTPSSTLSTTRQTTSWVPDAFSNSAPDTRVPFSTKRNPFARRY